MKKQRDIFYGVVLYMFITTFIGFILGINRVTIEFFGIPQQVGIIAEVLLYIATLWFLNEKFTRYPQIKWWAFVGMLLIILINRCLSYCLITYEFSFSNIIEQLMSHHYEILDKVFIMFMLFFAYRRYNQDKRDYVWYGVILAILINIAYYINYNLTTTLTLYLGSVASIFFITAGVLFFYLFFRTVQRRPHISVYLIIGLFILYIATDMLSIFGRQKGGYFEDYMYLFICFNLLVSLFLYSINFIAYIGYYQLNKKFRKVISMSSRNIVWMAGVIIIAMFYIGGKYTLASHSALLYNYRKTLRDFPPFLTNHFPLFTTGNISHNSMKKVSPQTILLTEVGLNAIDKAKEILNKDGILAEYQPSDSTLILIGINSKKKKSPHPSEINFAEGHYPILYNHRFYYDAETEHLEIVIPEYFKIYIIDAKPTNSEGEVLETVSSSDKNWEHGYSKGIYINEKDRFVYYWAISW